MKCYGSIIHKPLRLRTNVSETVRDLLEHLLQKEPKLRMGYEGDFATISRHPFFRPVDWPMLMERRVRPPYNQNVVRLSVPAFLLYKHLQMIYCIACFLLTFRHHFFNRYLYTLSDKLLRSAPYRPGIYPRAGTAVFGRAEPLWTGQRGQCF